MQVNLSINQKFKAMKIMFNSFNINKNNFNIKKLCSVKYRWNYNICMFNLKKIMILRIVLVHSIRKAGRYKWPSLK